MVNLNNLSDCGDRLRMPLASDTHLRDSVGFVVVVVVVKHVNLLPKVV